ncbi:hypothetical protein ACTWQF_10485 [Streptomyces sp. 8N114]|uniref:hypothetical protein n=1 Tax=Streptomyces sp. 8N114 TaxID=3457419 RepID=UPI003FD223A6
MFNTGPGRVAKPSKVRKILGYTPEVRAGRQAEDEVNRMSSRLVDAMGIHGTPSHIPAAAGPCDAIDPDFTTYYIVDHPWALWEADADKRAQLPYVDGDIGAVRGDRVDALPLAHQQVLGQSPAVGIDRRGSLPRSVQTVSQDAACSCRPSTGHFSVSTVVRSSHLPSS